jgi:Rieske Fe-S protein
LATLGGCAPRIDLPLAIAVDAPTAGSVKVPLTRIPEFLDTGASLILHPDAVDDLGRPISILVVNSARSGKQAFDAYCPHSRCELAYDAAADEVVCPCHLSRFDIGGAVLNPPATSDLTKFKIDIVHSTQELSVDISDKAFPAPVDGKLTFSTDDLPALQKVGGSVTGHSPGVPFPLIAVRTSPTTLSVLVARCSHQGCAVYGTGAQLLICKCHGSLFATDGQVKSGPTTQPDFPMKPLAQLTVLSFDGTTAVIKVA